MRHCRIPFLMIAALSFAAPGQAAPRRTVAARAPARVASPAPDPAILTAIRDEAGGSLRRFYAGRGYAPLWVQRGRIGPAADSFIGFLKTAEADGLRPSSYDIDTLRAVVGAARSGEPDAVARAELMLSDRFARYVRDQRRAGNGVRMVYADRGLKPKKPKPEAILNAAALSGDFADYVAGMGWMSAHYVRLRGLLARADKAGESEEALDRIRLNLDRARLLPGPWTMHVVVDASSARLWYYQGGRQLGTMKVVVGTTETQTPMMVGTLQWAILNPYWNIPDYLAEKNIAPKILAGRTLASMRIEALSDWSAHPARLDPASIDWQAVASGARVIRLRELPGGANSMGRVKFLFPNDEGIYLHDTPNRDLFDKDDRHLSNGCIRLEDAAALGRWLMRQPVTAAGKAPEQFVPLPVQVPVYLTYLTATETPKGAVFRPDVYGRDE
ncbi:L,D-transpeptidase family protein [Sphingobium sufflavum]|uniref:L,D-transpeptidase family protein n=1 Tax=Sphingobium sufflavum TaxID=1129547 RepID=UPI001EFF9389|nr:L,D-transpeptidase family protein [Sphingobium sufflavum]MCE7795935.1 L,D-transpeptidase family protein [Sphingobium sufflavum]